MPDDGDAPGPAQELLSGTPAHVGNVGVMDREPEDPAGENHNGMSRVKAKQHESPGVRASIHPQEQRQCALPFQLSAPQNVLLPVHQDGVMLVFPLFDGVGASSDGSHLTELWDNRCTIKQMQLRPD